eukprot:CAMPEP_0172453902 /NCGR_PEP_ID=MMETSP1065-20121228/11047_1 /TAXON_ID=265537 /ORGANISM="Amphiprora paludosa, Strain CCMP125" /LENGTH=400 /DNA_ID=CAMNT_0013206143 /DNA_START=158 /DNA_END=1360 /DNA_ORIENTATION=-
MFLNASVATKLAEAELKKRGLKTGKETAKAAANARRKVPSSMHRKGGASSTQKSRRSKGGGSSIGSHSSSSSRDKKPDELSISCSSETVYSTLDDEDISESFHGASTVAESVGHHSVPSVDSNSPRRKSIVSNSSSRASSRARAGRDRAMSRSRQRQEPSEKDDSESGGGEDELRVLSAISRLGTKKTLPTVTATTSRRNGNGLDGNSSHHHRPEVEQRKAQLAASSAAAAGSTEGPFCYTTISRVMDSWEEAHRMPDFEQVVGRILARTLFTEKPESKAVFGLPSNTDVNSPDVLSSKRFMMHASFMVSMLDTALNMVGPDVDLLTELLVDLGRKHARAGVQKDMFPVLGDAIQDALMRVLPAEHFQLHIQRAWKDTFDQMTKEMIRGMEETEEDGAIE